MAALILTLAALAVTGQVSEAAGRLYGKISHGSYLSPRKLFEVNVPQMHNPFVVKPSVIRDEQRADGGDEVTFSVPDVGEAWRMGARPDLDVLPGDDNRLRAICDEELVRWVGGSHPHTVVSEDTISLQDGLALARIYFVEAASLGTTTDGDAAPKREDALIGVVALVSSDRKRVLYAVGQYDMDLGSHFRFMIEIVKAPKNEWLRKIGEDHLGRLRVITATLRML